MIQMTQEEEIIITNLLVKYKRMGYMQAREIVLEKTAQKRIYDH